MSQIFVRPAVERDYSAIAGIQATAPEAAQWPVGDYSNFPVLVALLDGRIRGFCAYRQSLPEEAEVLNIAVDPAARRNGLGKALLTALCEVVTGDIYLEVAENNQSAVSLYASLGWRPISLRRGYYNQGKINAVVMKKSSC